MSDNSDTPTTRGPRGRGRARIATNNPSPGTPPFLGSGSGSPQQGSSSPPRAQVPPQGPASPPIYGVSSLAITSSPPSARVVGLPAAYAPPTVPGDRNLRGAHRGLRTGMYDDFAVKSKPLDLQSKRGVRGEPLRMIANYYRLNRAPAWTLYEYHLECEPQLDSVPARKALLRVKKEEDEAAGGTSELGAYIFDGTKLYTATPFKDTDFHFEVKLKKGDAYSVTLKYHGPIQSGDPTYMHFFHLILRRCLYGMGLEEMGRHFFDHTAAIVLQAQRLALWPGYVTSLRQHEHDVLLCVETTHKVLRLDNVLTTIKQIQQSARGDPKQEVQNQLKDCIVMTTYNRKTYKVEDILFNISPKTTFETKKGPVTFAEYYKNRYNLEIQDLNQPLITAKPRKRDIHRGESQDVVINLIPELCQLTGLTDQMRENFSLMKELAKYLHVPPKERVKEIGHFMDRMQKNMKTISLDKWGLTFDQKLVPVEGRQLPPEKIIFAAGEETADQKGDWTKAFRGQKLLSTVNLNKWVVIVPQRDAGGVDNLARTMTKVAAPLNMRISNPTEVCSISDVRPATYLNAINNLVKKHQGLQLIFVIVPNNRPEPYGTIKKKLAVELGIPSQCFVAKNVTSKGLMSIATKVVVQMNAKLGGEPWTIKLPLKKLMVVGFDVYHGPVGSKGGSVGAMVASLSNTFARYFSTTSTFTRGNDSEFSRAMRGDLRKCIEAFQAENEGFLPERIVMFRDGVGDGQLKYVHEMELKEMNACFAEIYEKHHAPLPKFTLIVVTKKINTRVMLERGGNYDNPNPGCIVDDVVTLPDRYDFFLVSAAARQGTVSPCSYNVLFDDSGLDPDKLQMLTYKMCHMYFNWSGTVAVPAPCQYAHKLAFITGVSYAAPANKDLSKLLHFL